MSRRIVSVASHGNGAGKTRFLECLLRAHPDRFAAVKFTTIFSTGQFCPRDAQKRCACTRLHDRFEVIADRETIEQPGTDTGRLAAAGARRVLWCLAREGAHAEGWEHVRELLDDGGDAGGDAGAGADVDVVTEGNTALLVIPTNALVFIVNPAMPMRFWKSNWRALAVRADALVVNESVAALGRRKPAPPDARREALGAVDAAVPGRAMRVTADLALPWAGWASPLAALVGRHVTSPA